LQNCYKNIQFLEFSYMCKDLDKKLQKGLDL